LEFSIMMLRRALRQFATSSRRKLTRNPSVQSRRRNLFAAFEKLEDRSMMAIIVGWDTAGLTGYGSSPFVPTTSDPGVTSLVGLTRGGGISLGGTAAGGGWGGTDWRNTSAAEAASGGDTVTFGFTVAVGQNVSLSSIDQKYRRSGTGPSAGQWAYQINGGGFVDFGGTVSYASNSSSGAILPALDLTGISQLQNLAAGTQVEFRLANYNGTGSTGTWYVYNIAGTAEDLAINGTVTAGGGNTAPTITSNGGATLNLNVAENSTDVTAVDASDTETPTANLAYTLTGPDASLFNIGLNTGVITFASAPNFESPTDAGGDNVYNVTVTVTDTGTPGLTDTQDINVTVTNVNDVSPVNTIPGDQSTPQNTPRVFSTANGNVISVADSDSTTLEVILTVANGTLSLSGLTGLTGSGDGTASLTYTGTAAALNAALQGATFTPTNGFSGAASIQLVTSDLGNPGGGTPLTDTDTINITVNAAVNQPTISIPTTLTGTAGQTVQIPVILNTNGAPPAPITGFDLAIVYDSNVLTINSIDPGSALVGSWMVTPSFASDPGKIGVDASVSPGVATAINGQIVIINATIKGASPLGASALNLVMSTTMGIGPPTTVFTRLNDGATSSLMLSPAPTDGNSDANVDGILTVAAAPNTAPVNTVPSLIAGTEDTNVPFTAGNVITVADTESATVTTVVSVANATIGTLTATAGAGVVIAPDGLSVTFTGTPVAVTSALTTLVFIPALHRNTAATVTVATSDGSLSDSDDITINLAPVNDAPTITSNGGGATASLNVPENSTAVTTVIATDVDTPTTITYSISGADASLFSISPTGVLTFNTAPNFEAPTDAGTNGIYNVTVIATDNGSPGLPDSQDLTITVTNVNEVPTIASNGGGASATLNVPENSTAVTTVTANDPDASPGLVYSISGTDASLFSINSSTGALVFNPAPNFELPTDAGANGIYDVTVTVTDNGSLFDSQTLAVTVTNVNEAPSITSNGGAATASLSVAENQTAVTTVIATDPDATPGITYSVSGTDALLFTINPTTGVLVFNSAPNFEAPSDAGANGVYDIVVTATDSGSLFDTQALTVTLTNVNEAPVNTVPGAQNTAFNTPRAFNSGNGNLISIADVDAGASAVQVTLTVTNGTATFSGLGGLAGSGNGGSTLTYTGTIASFNAALNGLTFTPTPGFSGLATITIATNDQGNTGSGSPLSDSDTINITVASAAPQNPVNTVPASPVTGTEDVMLLLAGVSVMDTDSPSITTTITLPTGVGTLSATSGGSSVTPVINGPGTVVTFTGSPTAVTQALATLTFTPILNLNSTDGLISVNVATTDGSLSDSDNFTISLTPVNDAPVAVNDALASVNEDVAPIVFDASVLLANDLDQGASNESSQTLTFVDVNTASAVGGSVSRSGSTITFIPEPNFFGAASFTYTITDNGTPALTSTATASFTINSVNDAPVAVPDALTAVNEDAPAIVFDASVLLANDTDRGAPNESSQTLTFVDVNPASAVGGTVSRVGSTITFTPALNFFGTGTFTYSITDNGSPALTSTAIVSIPINSVNDAPSFTPGPNLTVPFNAPGQSLPWASAVSPGPANESLQTVSFQITNDHPEYFAGPVTISSTGQLTFAPAMGAVGTATITVMAQDDGGIANLGVNTSSPVIFTITIDPQPLNALPTIDAVTNIVLTENAGTQIVNLSGITAGGESQALQISATSSLTALIPVPSPTYTSPNATGAISFSPVAGQTGVSTITVEVRDTGLDGSFNTADDGVTTVSFTVTVNAFNDPPVANDLNLIAPFNTAVNGTLTASDPDGPALTYDISMSPTLGTISNFNPTTGTFTYTPTTGTTGLDLFNFTVTDGTSTDTGMVRVVIQGSTPVVIPQDGDLTILGTGEDDYIVVQPRNAGTVFVRTSAGSGIYPVLNRIIIDTGDGNDRVTLTNFNIPVTADLGAGDDNFAGTNGDDIIIGGLGSDRISPGAGRNVVWGDVPGEEDSEEGGNDTLSGGSDSEIFYGGGGDDRIGGGGGNDYIYGGTGRDVLTGGDGEDRVYGGSGNDDLIGNAGNDILSGGDGNDLLLGSEGNDIVIGGLGADTLIGNAGNDLLIAGATTNGISNLANDANDQALIALLGNWLASQPAGLATSILAGNDGVVDNIHGSSGNDDFYLSATDNPADFSLAGHNGVDRRVDN